MERCKFHSTIRVKFARCRLYENGSTKPTLTSDTAVATPSLLSYSPVWGSTVNHRGAMANDAEGRSCTDRTKDDKSAAGRGLTGQRDCPTFRAQPSKPGEWTALRFPLRLHSFRPDRRPPDPNTPFEILRCPVMSSEHHRGELYRFASRELGGLFLQDFLSELECRRLDDRACKVVNPRGRHVATVRYGAEQIARAILHHW